MAAPSIPPPPKLKSGRLSDGTYVIVSVEHKTVIDQDLADLKYVQGYTGIDSHKNQQWEVTAFGAGYVIRSKFDGAYLTVDSAIADNVAVVTSPFPVAWDLQAQDEENLIFQIRWPNSKFGYDLDKNTPGTRIRLKTHSGHAQLWQFKNTAAKGDQGNITKPDCLPTPKHPVVPYPDKKPEPECPPDKKEPPKPTDPPKKPDGTKELPKPSDVCDPPPKKSDGDKTKPSDPPKKPDECTPPKKPEDDKTKPSEPPKKLDECPPPKKPEDDKTKPSDPKTADCDPSPKKPEEDKTKPSEPPKKPDECTPPKESEDDKTKPSDPRKIVCDPSPKKPDDCNPLPKKPDEPHKPIDPPPLKKAEGCDPPPHPKVPDTPTKPLTCPPETKPNGVPNGTPTVIGTGTGTGTGMGTGTGDKEKGTGTGTSTGTGTREKGTGTGTGPTQPHTDTSGDLVDSQGAKLCVGSKYKIRFADGTEFGPGHLGLGYSMGGITLVSPRKSNSGAVCHFVLEAGVTDKTWKSGKVAYIGGKFSELDGKSVNKYISLSTPSDKEVLAFWTYEDAQKERGHSYGFIAKQMPNHRIALYARDQKRNECGLIVVGDKIIKDRSNLGVALDCTFVKVA